MHSATPLPPCKIWVISSLRAVSEVIQIVILGLPQIGVLRASILSIISDASYCM